MSVKQQRIAVTGVGESPIGKTPELDSMDLYSRACRAAVSDAGLEKNDIDGMLTGYSIVDPKLMLSTVLCDRLGLRPRFNASLRVGGATPFVGVCHAASAIRQGQCENVLVTFGDNRRSGWDDGVNELADSVNHPEFEDPFGPTIPGLYALLARAHMDRYGTTPKELAEVAVACHHHAAKRNEGQRAKRMTVEEVLREPVIADPLHRSECALITDCAGALVVSSKMAADDAREPVELLGYGEGHGSEHLLHRSDLTTSEAVRSGEIAFAMADRTPDEVDVAQLYDCFTITVLILLEDLGFCEKGKAGKFVRERGIMVDDDLPVNTHGGELAYAGAGIFHIIEAVRQLRGNSGATQVDDVETALTHGVGGILSTNATLILEAW